LLLLEVPREPPTVVEEQNVRAQHGTAGSTARKFAEGHACVVIRLHVERGCVGDVISTGLAALQMMDGTVALHDAPAIESGAVEVAVDIAGEHHTTVREALAYPAENLESLVGLGLAVEFQAMSVESPGQTRVGVEGAGIGDLGEVDDTFSEGRVGAPEALSSAEIGEAGVDAHAGTGTNDEAIRGTDGLDRTVDFSAIEHSAYFRVFE